MPLSRSERRHAASNQFVDRSILILLLFLTLLGGAHALVETMAPREIPISSLEVPNLNGARSLEEAQEMAGEDFVVEGVLVESGEPVGTVASQDPKAGEMVDRGSTISVRISGRQIVDLPDVEGKTLEEAEQSIRGRPFELEVKTEESSPQKLDTVLEQEPKGGGGVTAQAGTRVKITIGGGPSAVETQRVLEQANPLSGDQAENSGDRAPSHGTSEQRTIAEEEIEPGSLEGNDVVHFAYASWQQYSAQYGVAGVGGDQYREITPLLD